jgi:serine/threonine protein kinase/Flp pilus assembly protein TadD
MLGRALGCETETTETLEEVLDEIDVRDADWRIGNYQILEEIGRGGMGVIYRARQRHSRRIVALKRILSYQAESQETLVRFRREAEAAASLDHPNILPIYEVSESDDGLLFFSMKFAAGGSLLDAARALRKDPRRIITLMAKVTRAVQYAHVQGILHRDLKPGNILLDGRGEPLVSDFGLAKWLDTSSDITRTLTIFGTPGYIAPEQAKSPAKHLIPAADIYSLGAVLFDLFTGRTPFLGEHALAVIKQAGEKPAPKLRTLTPLADRDVETICAKCLEREPQARYRSAGDLAQDLERWLEGRPIIARPVSPPVRIWRWAKRNPKLAGSLAAAVILGSVGVIAAFTSSRLSSIVKNAEIARRSVAVIPFEDLDELSKDSPQARAATKAFVAELGGTSGIKVRSSIDKFTEGTDFWRTEDWQRIGEVLKTPSACAGTIRHRGGSLRIALRFISTESGKTLWTKIYDEPTEATGSAITGVVQDVKATSRNEIANSEVDVPDSCRNAQADDYLRAGKLYYYRYNPADTTTSLQYFEKALQADADCAIAHAFFALGWARHLEEMPETFTDDNEARAFAAATEAIRLNPQLSFAYLARAALLARVNVTAALEPALCALELNPNDVLPAGIIGFAWRMRGRPDLALRWLRRSANRGQRPGMNAAAIGDALTELGADEAAERAYRQQFEFWPDIPDSHVGLARLWIFQGDHKRALAECQDALQRYPDHVYVQQMLGVVEFWNHDFGNAEAQYRKLVAKDRNGGGDFYGCISNLSALGFLRLRAGDPDGHKLIEEALRLNDRALSKVPFNRETLYDQAGSYAALGDGRKALQTLARAISAGWIDARSLKLDPRFDTIRDEHSFRTSLDDLAAKTAALRRKLPAAELAQLK